MKLHKFLLTIILFTCYTAFIDASTPKVIAHRGYWKTDGSAQNSIRSLIKADSIGCYASEFDVWMTADSVLVVNHDADINGIVIEKSNSDKVLSQALKNGEKVPTLDNLLQAASQTNLRLILELKEHDSSFGEKEAVKKVLQSIDKYGLNDRVEYITFSKEAFKNFVQNAPVNTPVYYLEGDYIPSQIKHVGGKGIDYSLRVLKKHPEWIKESHDLGLEVNVWTVDKKDDMLWCIDQGVDYITTNEPELLQSLLQNVL